MWKKCKNMWLVQFLLATSLALVTCKKETRGHTIIMGGHEGHHKVKYVPVPMHMPCPRDRLHEHVSESYYYPVHYTESYQIQPEVTVPVAHYSVPPPIPSYSALPPPPPVPLYRPARSRYMPRAYHEHGHGPRHRHGRRRHRGHFHRHGDHFHFHPDDHDDHHHHHRPHSDHSHHSEDQGEEDYDDDIYNTVKNDGVTVRERPRGIRLGPYRIMFQSSRRSRA